jgi:hypothetical protein
MRQLIMSVKGFEDRYNLSQKILWDERRAMVNVVRRGSGEIPFPSKIGLAFNLNKD